ncbi:Hsp20/alpha crystallin family protein [Haloechinothrix sp. YIM 98757]|uniref:Hsp20/alpha crystallin family protein n=1 Tax=Haloechinothrix aidingensis TaxID=2752311 RepID=A0A838AC85_9PSEU|nr:Hsp20/alpha crystallin family protein [Haloechinothrix aidingensis]MBA0126872.1 Hsp20/alpha crystallin family protein [Haloechinothrix aidingensis]
MIVTSQPQHDTAKASGNADRSAASYPHELGHVEEYYTDGMYLVHVTVPATGSKADITIWTSGDALLVTMRCERARHGALTRSVGLPSGADTGGISASYKPGMLEVRVPVVAVGQRGDVAS